MYLDTDIILALIKKEDWLKKYVKISSLKPAKTSALTIIEARIVLEREYGKKESITALSKINHFKIQIIPLGEKTLEKSNELMEKYPKLGIFDSIHAACSMLANETLLSTDSVFLTINELRIKDPRSF